jgi:hypothetical protein
MKQFRPEFTDEAWIGPITSFKIFKKIFFSASDIKKYPSLSNHNWWAFRIL